MLHGTTLPADLDDARLLRNRELDPTIGRWTRQDPVGYIDGMSLYEMERSQPTMFSDPMGLLTDWTEMDPQYWTWDDVKKTFEKELFDTINGETDGVLGKLKMLFPRLPLPRSFSTPLAATLLARKASTWS